MVRFGRDLTKAFINLGNFSRVSGRRVPLENWTFELRSNMISEKLLLEKSRNITVYQIQYLKHYGSY